MLLQVLGGDFIDASTFAPLATLALVGVLGTADDWLNARTGDGIRVRQKLLWQTVVARRRGVQIQQTYDIDAARRAVPRAVRHPAAGCTSLFAAFAIVATSNGVNITDGLDGLSGGTLIFAFVGYMVIAALNQPGRSRTSPSCARSSSARSWASCGSTSTRPQVFMGDSGALALGATLAVVALITGQILLLPLIGFVFVLETAQDILQIAVVQVRTAGGSSAWRRSITTSS